MKQLALFINQPETFPLEHSRISALQENIISYIYDIYIGSNGKINRFSIEEIYEMTSRGFRQKREFRNGLKSLEKKSMIVYIDDNHIKLTAQGIGYGRYLAPVEPTQYFNYPNL